MNSAFDEIGRAVQLQSCSDRGLRRPVPIPMRTWSPAVATGFLGLVIVSAMAGIVAILSAIR